MSRTHVHGNPTILVIGGFGFIGGNLLDRFLFSGRYNVIVFEFMNVAPKLKSHLEHTKVYYGDFNNPKDLELVFTENRIDIVMHLISTTVPATSNENIPYDIQSNIVDTIGLLEIMRRFEVKKIVFLSSGGTVYGIPASLPIRESDPTDPICSYGITKLSIEKYIHLFQYLHGIDYLILRPSNPFGKYHTSTKQGFINVVLRNILEGRSVTIWGDGSIVRDYMFVEDLAEAVFMLVEKGVSNKIVNVGSGEGHSLRQILNIISGKFPKAKIVYHASRNFDIQKQVLDTTRLQELTGINLTPLETGITKTIEWLLENIHPVNREI